ncbi:MAG: UDP-N-acetylmuramoyl-L-alanine--D-glutamate ligase [bacterium]|nr:UDP-N-acetylmuramoyl-L-alanine--D-glutamate ligase [bacterium]
MITLKDLQQGEVAILGFGVNNRELTKWLVKHQVKVTVCDEQEAVANQAAGQTELELKDKVQWQLGAGAFDGLERFNYLIRTPGMRPDHAGIVAGQSRGGAILTSQTELFFHLTPATTIGITGTKGKGTTASLLYSMLQEGRSSTQFKNIYLAGNIGTDPFTFFDDLQTGDLVLLELSSFQLFLANIRPKIAIVLSLSPDHLDYHPNVHEYVAAKTYLVRNQTKDDITILHQENPWLSSFTSLTPAEIYTYSRQNRVNRGTYVADYLGKKAIFMTGEVEPLLTAADLSIPGEHNLENAAAAALAAYLLGVPRPALAKGAQKFTGLPHRLQTRMTYNKVTVVDDSIATTPEAALAAINAFEGHAIHLLLGGVSKGASYKQLVAAAEAKCQTVTIIGRNRSEIAAHFKKLEPYLADNMESAIHHILPQTGSGAIVLLAPASASFDLYRNYAERGDDFADRVAQNKTLIPDRE